MTNNKNKIINPLILLILSGFAMAGVTFYSWMKYSLLEEISFFWMIIGILLMGAGFTLLNYPELEEETEMILKHNELVGEYLKK